MSSSISSTAAISAARHYDGEEERGEVGLSVKRVPGACSNCKRLKMKCVFGVGQTICQRCQNTNKICIVEGRNPRGGPSKPEQPRPQLTDKDISAIIEYFRRKDQTTLPYSSHQGELSKLSTNSPPAMSGVNPADPEIMLEDADGCTVMQRTDDGKHDRPHTPSIGPQHDSLELGDTLQPPPPLPMAPSWGIGHAHGVGMHPYSANAGDEEDDWAEEPTLDRVQPQQQIPGDLAPKFLSVSSAPVTSTTHDHDEKVERGEMGVPKRP
ncbi:hypothetical protein FRC08_007011 [Ceratobasidium sp. 394]|nr:hypothetical protein FRC08_007011 [Ceratobasidium sp. 394]